MVKYMSDYIAVMYLGKILEMAPRVTLFTNHRHPYTEALLSAVPVPALREKKKRIVLQGDIPSPIQPPPGCKFHPRCPYRKEPCEQVEPALRNVGDGHWLACHL